MLSWGLALRHYGILVCWAYRANVKQPWVEFVADSNNIDLVTWSSSTRAPAGLVNESWPIRFDGFSEYERWSTWTSHSILSSISLWGLLSVKLNCRRIYDILKFRQFAQHSAPNKRAYRWAFEIFLLSRKVQAQFGCVEGNGTWSCYQRKRKAKLLNQAAYS